MTVYVVQSPMRRSPTSGELEFMHDLTPARVYGELSILLPSGPVLIDPEPAIRTLRDKLKDFTDLDSLLCMGDPVAIAAAASIVSDVNRGVVPLLVWDRTSKLYNRIRVDICKSRTHQPQE